MCYCMLYQSCDSHSSKPPHAQSEPPLTNPSSPSACICFPSVTISFLLPSPSSQHPLYSNQSFSFPLSPTHNPHRFKILGPETDLSITIVTNLQTRCQRKLYLLSPKASSHPLSRAKICISPSVPQHVEDMNHSHLSTNTTPSNLTLYSNPNDSLTSKASFAKEHPPKPAPRNRLPLALPYKQNTPHPPLNPSTLSPAHRDPHTGPKASSTPPPSLHLAPTHLSCRDSPNLSRGPSMPSPPSHPTTSQPHRSNLPSPVHAFKHRTYRREKIPRLEKACQSVATT